MCVCMYVGYGCVAHDCTCVCVCVCVHRSKYDTYSGRMISKYDHYCPLIGETVGELNYRDYLLCLCTHVCVCWYNALLGVRVVTRYDAT